MKIVINTCYGGFGLSTQAFELYLAKKGVASIKSDERLDIPRDDADLVNIVCELGKRANNNYSDLKIVEIPDDVEWQIQDYDGIEWVSEKHRIWS